MKLNTQEKSLIPINENSIFYKIKKFFRKLFHKEELCDNSSTIEVNTSTEIDNKRNAFIKSIKNIEDKQTKLLKLQKQYHSGEIKEENLTKEQINALCDLYKIQNSVLKKSNELKKQKIAEYKKRKQIN